MTTVNARFINLLRPNTSGTWTTLDQYMNRRRVFPFPWNEVQSVAVSAANFVLIDSTTHLPGGLLAVLDASPPVTALTNGGVCAAELAGAIGTAATTTHTDNLGNILNLVPIRDSSTHNEITVNVAGTDYTVMALVQCANGVAEGAAIGAAASENTQLSFVYVAANGTLTLTAITATIDFTVNKLYIESQQPDIVMVGGRPDEILIEPSAPQSMIARGTVTAQFASGEVITISTGAGAGTGTSTIVITPTGSTVVLPASAALFNNDPRYSGWLNGVRLIKGSGLDIEWESTTTFSINHIMDINDVFEIEVPAI